MNLSEIRTALDRRTGLAFDTTAQTALVNEAVAFISADYSWPWLQAVETVTTVASTGTYNVAGDWAQTLELRRASDNFELIALSIGELEDSFDPSSDANGEPWAFAIYGEQIRLRPVPDAVYSLTHRYYKTEPVLSNTTDTPLMPVRFHHAIVEYAAHLAFRRAGKQNQASAALEGYKMWRERMADDRRRRVGPVKVRIRPGAASFDEV